MSASRTIVLELLRDGPPHNQLLSPLTVYLAACQNRPPEALRLAVEHRDFLRWQGGLTYAGVRRIASRTQGFEVEALASLQVVRRNALEDASAAVTAVLGSIRALIAELASEPCEWRHIHLVFDATELGALPFELARAAPGFVVEGERLFVQQNARVTLTRQTRRVATSVVSWPSRPRLLCIIANGNLPTDAHVLALRKSIDQWIGWNDGEDNESQADDDEQLIKNRTAEAAQMLTVLENPTLDEVSAETRRTRYTHVHLLAHGAPLTTAEPSQSLFGLRFRGREGTLDVVDGERLEAALRHGNECSDPTVVTLATCDGANVSGSILGPGGSAAHALHAKGIPLVVASQFPLSTGASAIFAEILYGEILRGEDPRKVVHAIRRELLVAYPETHDWASLVVYGSFPSDLEVQLHRVRQTAEKLALETAVERLRVSLRWHVMRDSALLKESEARLADDTDRLDSAAYAVQTWTFPENDISTRVLGLRTLARMALRLWDVYRLRSQGFDSSVADRLGRKQKHDVSTGQRPVSMLRPQELLEFARSCYETAYYLDPSRPEVWAQVMVLSWALSLPPTPHELPSRFRSDLRAVRYMSLLAGERVAMEGLGGREARALAAAMSFEVELLAYIVKEGLLDEKPHLTQDELLDVCFERLIKAVTPVSESYRAHAMWRQLKRYEQLLRQAGDKPLNADGRVHDFRLKLEDLGVRKYWGPRA